MKLLKDMTGNEAIAYLEGRYRKYKEWEKERYKWGHFLDQTDKCQTAIQQGVFSEILRIFPKAEIEKEIVDNKYNIKWGLDIFLNDKLKFSIECDGNQHRNNYKRFTQDETKDTFLFRKGIYVFRRSNRWWNLHYKKFPEMLLNFIIKQKEMLGVRE